MTVKHLMSLFQPLQQYHLHVVASVLLQFFNQQNDIYAESKCVIEA